MTEILRLLVHCVIVISKWSFIIDTVESSKEDDKMQIMLFTSTFAICYLTFGLLLFYWYIHLVTVMTQTFLLIWKLRDLLRMFIRQLNIYTYQSVDNMNFSNLRRPNGRYQWRKKDIISSKRSQHEICLIFLSIKQLFFKCIRGLENLL